MTYSIIGITGRGEIGAAVQSKFPGVSSLILHGEAGAGMIATQAFSNPEHGQRGLALLRIGVHPDMVRSILLENDPDAGQRQFAIMDVHGQVAGHTGDEVTEWSGFAGSRQGPSCIALGNSLASEDVLDAMTGRFAAEEGDLARRLIAAVRAGEQAGGELRGVQSAGVQVYKPGGGYGGTAGRHVDIAVYDHSDPIAEMARCYELHRLSYFPSDEDDLIKITPELARLLSRILVDEGYLDGDVRDQWGTAEIKAMKRFMGAENYDNRIRDDALIDREVLADIKKKRSLSD